MSMTTRVGALTLASAAFLAGACAGASTSSGSAQGEDGPRAVTLTTDDDVQGQIDELTSKVDELSSTVDDLSSTVDELGGNLGPSTERNVTSLDERVSDLESR